MTERQQLSRIILTLDDLKEQSPYKKVYSSVIETLKNKLRNMRFEGYKEIVENPTTPIAPMLESNIESSLTNNI